jgi:8-oxo-dGTP pyrophosphatase MutT (NUDIX family)
VPRPAATVMVIRDGVESLEVLMLRRSLESDFVPSAYVFPGGAVDAADGAAEMLERCTGRDDAQASAVLDLASGGLSYWVSAFRECFEEAGVLVAIGPDARPIGFEDPAVEARFSAHRRELNAGRCSFLDVCLAEGLTLPADSLYYVGHWITPVGGTRRYDTRFFVTLAPRGQTAVHDEIETIAHMWVAPNSALEQHEAGRIELLFPTIFNLQLLAGFTTTADLVASVSKEGAVATIAPEIVVDEHGNRQIVLPGDPRHVGTVGADEL